MSEPKRCGTCTHLAVPPNARGVVSPRKGNAYRCRAPVPEPMFPESVRKAYGFQWPPSKSSMEPHDGVTCPAWVKRTPATGGGEP